MYKLKFVTVMTLFFFGAVQHGYASDGERQAQVAERGAEVMPFALAATRHLFTKAMDGGSQQVVARNPHDLAQVRLIRAHLRQIAGRFAAGDFSSPSKIHGPSMPGLAELGAAQPGAINIVYADLPDGGQITYTTAVPALVAALNKWFDAQLSDHGADAEQGHAMHSH